MQFSVAHHEPFLCTFWTNKTHELQPVRRILLQTLATGAAGVKYARKSGSAFDSLLLHCTKFQTYAYARVIRIYSHCLWRPYCVHSPHSPYARTRNYVRGTEMRGNAIVIRCTVYLEPASKNCAKGLHFSAIH